MSRQNIESISPLSAQQQGMLLETLAAAEPGIHIEQEIRLLRGDIDLPAFERAWQSVVDRHAILRTAFVWKDQPEPLQVTFRRVKVDVKTHDLLALSPADQEDHVEEFLRADRRTGFELSRAPLMRLTVFDLAHDRRRFVWSKHHLISDGWSWPLIWRDVADFYDAYREGRALHRETSRPYGEYVAWVAKQDLRQAEGFWRRELEDFSKPTVLGRIDASIGSAGPENRYGSAEARLDPDATARLQSFGRQHHITSSTLVQAAWALLLSRYSGEEDVVFGTTVSGRPPELQGVESMVGPFLNTLPFRVRVPRGTRLKDWLKEVQARHLEARRYEYCSMGQIQPWGQVAASVPLCESILVFQNYPVDFLEAGSGSLGFDIRSGRSDGAQTKYPLTILVNAGPEVTVRLVYDTRRFEMADVSRVPGHFLRVLGDLAGDPGRPLAALWSGIPVEEVPRFKPFDAIGCPDPRDFVAPQTETEKRVARVWAEVLARPVGLRENFFELGGHSLVATRVLSRLKEEFSVELPLRALFEGPTVEALAVRIEEIRGKEESAREPAMRAIPRTDPIPLSFAQHRLWFLDQMEPGSAFYGGLKAIRIEGPLRPDVLESALDAIVRRHEALRTTFVAGDGSPAQRIAPPQRLSLPVTDLGEIPEDEREREVRRLLDSEANRPFDLARGPLFRVRLLRLGLADHMLLMGMHHIVSDGWSLGILFRELGILYEAFRDGRSSPLSDLPLQHADFAAWQRQWMQGDVLTVRLEYWKKRLQGALSLLELPTDRPRPPVQSSRGASESLLLPERLARAIEALGRARGATLFMTLLAGFQALLARYTRQDDIVVGSTTSGRNSLEMEKVVGLFLNTVVLRTRFSDSWTFEELLDRVRETSLEAFANEEVPFEKLMEELKIERTLSHSPLFQVHFVLQNLPSSALQIGDLTFTDVEVESATAKFDLMLDVRPKGEDLLATLSYRTDLFDSGTIARMLEHFRMLLEAVAAEPKRRWTDVPLLTASERRLVLTEWVETEGDYPREECVHHLFESQAAATPDAVALEFDGDRLTYRELDRRSNRVARHLRRLGVGPESLVALCVERSFDMVVGLLGVLKSGGAYVPFDPINPRERLRRQLADSNPLVVLTQRALAERLPADGRAVLFLDECRSDSEEESEEAPAGTVTPDNLAYVIYTSGSTGEPKGVEITHRALVNFTTVAAELFALSPADRVLQFASVSFDAAAEEIFSTLTRGATLVLRTESMLGTAATFLERCREWRLSVLDLPTAYWHHLVAAMSEEGLTLPEPVRLVILGGERALPERLALWGRLVRPGVRLLNTYGPTEATVVATAFEAGGAAAAVEPWSPSREVPIGRPIRNVRVYILDRCSQPVPPGVPGELHIGGLGLARGYRNRPELTAEKFVAHSLPDGEQIRLYGTGDLARYLSDGNIEYCGRLDGQVKIRGFRVELGEVEAMLVRHTMVREAAVVAWEDEPGDKRLVAYIVADRANRPPSGELYRFSRESLPAYMVPSAFVTMDALPLTTSGKLDRAALPAPDPGRPARDDAYVPLRTPVQEVLSGIWSDVLRVAQVGLADNFFELGGHSLLATQVVSRVREAFRVEVTLRDIFEEPKLEGLAEVIERAQRTEKSEPPAPALTRVPRDQELPLSFAQQRMWVMDQLDPGGSSYNIPLAIRIVGPLGVGALEKTVAALVERHEVLRTSVEARSGQATQRIADRVAVAMPITDLAGWPPDEREIEARRIANEQSREPFDLSRAPLVRTGLLRMGPEDHVFLLTLHHFVCDAWSVGVLFDEFAILYRAFCAGEPSPLPDLPIQYADYAVWQRQWLEGGRLERQLAYWKERLAGVPPLLKLETDRPRPAVQSFRGGRCPLAIGQDVTEPLRGFARREGVTLYMVLLTTFVTLLSRHTDQEDIVVGSPIAGRHHLELEGLIGCFLNTLVLRTDLSGDPTFRQVLRRVRETSLGAYAHQDVPFERLVEEIRPARTLSHNPLVQVWFVVQNAPRQEMDLAGVELSQFEVDTGTVRHDLRLTLWESATGLAGAFDYSADLFDPETIARWARRLGSLLSRVLAHPDSRVRELHAELEAEDDAERRENQKQLDGELRRRLEQGGRRTVRA